MNRTLTTKEQRENKLMPPTYKRKRGNAPKQRLFAVADPESGLPSLTPKQEAFVTGILEGKSARDAYRDAYDCKAMSDNSVSNEAYRLRTNPEIARCIALYQRNALQIKVSQDGHLAELARLRELAVDNGQISAGVQAEHYRGKVAGLYEDKLKLQIGLSDDLILSQLGSFLGPELLSSISQGLGLESQPQSNVVDLEASEIFHNKDSAKNPPYLIDKTEESGEAGDS